MQANEIEAVGALPALMYGAAQFIGASMHTSLSYVHQHGGQQDLLLFRTNETPDHCLQSKARPGLHSI